MTEKIANHLEQGLGLLLYQFEDSTLRSLLSPFLAQVQDLEDAAHPVVDARNIDSATGHRLDGIGQIVNVKRKGRADEEYRIWIRAELSILKSRGTSNDLINVLQLLLGMPSPDIQLDEYFPKAVYLRARNTRIPSGADTVADLLRRAAPAATKLVFVYGVQDRDSDLFAYDVGGLGYDQGRYASNA